jgi:hypothetical protein
VLVRTGDNQVAIGQHGTDEVRIPTHGRWSPRGPPGPIGGLSPRARERHPRAARPVAPRRRTTC